MKVQELRSALLTHVPDEAGPDTVCRCGHWFEEHFDGEPAGCAGCEAPHPHDDAYQHGFEFDPEENTPDAIADRGGDPELWPEWVKVAYGHSTVS